VLPSTRKNFVIAWFVALAFTVISLIHVDWALGGRLGTTAAIPHVPGAAGSTVPAFKPGMALTLLVASALASVAVLVALRAGLFGLPLPHWTIQVAIGVVAIVMFARAVGDFRLIGFFKRTTGSRFAQLDTWLYSPLCVALGIGLAVVAWD
jgi:hypothetical protein